MYTRYKFIQYIFKCNGIKANAEFSFVFEKCTPNRKYCGWEGYDRRRTVVCVGDGKPMAETGEDYRTKRKVRI